MSDWRRVDTRVVATLGCGLLVGTVIVLAIWAYVFLLRGL